LPLPLTKASPINNPPKTNSKYKTPNDPVKEQIAQDKYGKSYDELTAHERIVVGGTKGGITTKEGDYAGAVCVCVAGGGGGAALLRLLF
jgi:hypothetical protein